MDQGHNYIGWEAPLNGNVSTVWKEIQHQYYLFLGKGIQASDRYGF
jgi:hypothetical protein